MEVLNNILIKNIRRFGDNVDIEVGPGATIFYAPNGTGKTSIFEAIELALTGTVRRLNTNLKPLIRDKCSDSSVQLNFNSGKYCHVHLEHGNRPVLTGNHDTLFGKTPAENVPYLLRLTHLLNQRGDGWFVQSESNIAGAQLDYLAIGREAAQANKIMISAKKAANQLSTEAQRELSEAENIYNEWLSLLKKRSSNINLDPSRPLISYDTLFGVLNAIAKRYGLDKLTFGNDIQLLKSQRDEVLAILVRRKAEWIGHLVGLNTLQPIVEEYEKESINLIEQRRANTSLLQSKSEIDYAIKRLELDLSGLDNQLNISNLKYKEDAERLEKLQSAFRSEEKINDINAQLEVSKDLVREADKAYNDARVEYVYVLNINNEHQIFSKREVALAEEKSAIMLQINEAERWRELNRSIAQLNSLKPDLSEAFDKEVEAFQKLANQRDNYKLNLSELQKTFEVINSANSNILAAVGIIASELPAERGDCPVCAQTYEPLELHRRIKAALDAINPELQKTSSKIDDAKARISSSDKKISIANSRVIKSRELLYNVNESIRTAQRELTSLIDKVFPSFNTPESAEQYCYQALVSNENSIAALASDRNSAMPIRSVEELAVLKGVMDTAAVNLKSAQERVASLQRTLYKALNDSSDEIANISWEKFYQLDKLVSGESANINNVTRAIEAVRKDIENQYVLLNDANIKLSSANRLMLDINTSISQYKAKWTALGLRNEPSRELLSEAISIFDGRIKVVESDIKSIEQLGDEIARWLSFVEHASIEESIKSARASLSEADYSDALYSKVKSLIDKCELIQRNLETLDSFSNNLSSELDEVHKLIKTINPLWNSLLKRIVVDPRFSKTALDSYSYYKKQRADVNIKLHGEDTLATHVASEAQITDLQLTFLLALAQTYKWIPWRALLLDDPTQHHDLVHASAVFDLLRDYIAEKDFQVLLATHDYVQAKFFMRKLQNDGIPARICTLQATSTGVVPIYKG